MIAWQGMDRVHVLLLCLIYLLLSKSLARTTCSPVLLGEAMIRGAHLRSLVAYALCEDTGCHSDVIPSGTGKTWLSTYVTSYVMLLCNVPILFSKAGGQGYSSTRQQTRF